MLLLEVQVLQVNEEGRAKAQERKPKLNARRLGCVDINWQSYSKDVYSGCSSFLVSSTLFS